MRLYLRSADRRPDPPPLRTNDRAVVSVGMVAWAVLLVAALVMRSRLVEQGRGWWVWTPVVAIALGFYGLHYLRQRERRRTDEPEARTTQAQQATRTPKAHQARQTHQARQAHQTRQREHPRA